MKVDKCIILAAGKGTRMKSNLAKVLHPLCGRTMIDWVLSAVTPVSAGASCIVVVNNKAGEVAQYLKSTAHRRKGSVVLAEQAEQLGTGHAVQCALPHVKGAPREGYILITAGDMPMLSTASLEKLCEQAKENEWAAAVLTAKVAQPEGYGRIVRDDAGHVARIVEQKDAVAEDEKALEKDKGARRLVEIDEVNTSVYCFQTQPLLDALQELTNENQQGEYYLTQCVDILHAKGMTVGAVCVDDSAECMGINDRKQLAQAEALLRFRILCRHMENGVTIIDPTATYVDADVTIGQDTIIAPNNHLQGNTAIGQDCVLYPGNRIVSSMLGSGVEVQNSTILSSVVGNGATIHTSALRESKVGDEAQIGPYVQLRPHAVIGIGCRVGNFVEVKNSKVGDGSKISHLSYIGDGIVGKDCNIGCGVVFVNYDGLAKYETVVEDKAFIGCNSNLVAPVTVGKNAYIGAGSTITKDVPPGALGIERAKQVNRENWAARNGRIK